MVKRRFLRQFEMFVQKNKSLDTPSKSPKFKDCRNSQCIGQIGHPFECRQNMYQTSQENFPP